MASIRIKTDSLDIKIADIKPNEFTGAWQWVLDVLETMNACKGDPVKAIEDEIDDTPFDVFSSKGYEIKRNAAGIIDAIKIRASHDGYEGKEKYDARGGEPKEVFEKICNDYVEKQRSYSPEMAAKLTGKICARFFYEQGKKGAPLR